MPHRSTLNGRKKVKVKVTTCIGSQKIYYAALSRIYYAYPQPNKWSYAGLQGALSVVLEQNMNTYHFRMVDLGGTRGVIWDHELYDGLELPPPFPPRSLNRENKHGPSLLLQYRPTSHPYIYPRTRVPTTNLLKEVCTQVIAQEQVPSISTVTPLASSPPSSQHGHEFRQGGRRAHCAATAGSQEELSTLMKRSINPRLIIEEHRILGGILDSHSGTDQQAYSRGVEKERKYGWHWNRKMAVIWPRMDI